MSPRPISSNMILLAHLTGSCLFLFMPMVFHPPQVELINPFALNGLVSRGIILVFFYLNYLYLIPQNYWQNKRLLYILLSIGFLGLAVCIPNWIFPHKPHFLKFPDLHKMHKNHSWGFLKDISRVAFVMLGALGLSWGLYLNRIWNRLKEEKSMAELSYLKAQINPHFLFNTLNSIYSLSLTNSEDTPDALIKLSEMMRYVLYETKTEKVALEKELAYIEGYIALQKLRLTSLTKVDFKAAADNPSLQIEPLLMIAFIENAFKYGVSTDLESQIDIKVNQNGEWLEMDCENDMVVEKKAGDEANGIGIDNVKKRLELVYPGKHQLLIKENGTRYSVKLKIQLQ